MCSKSSDFYLQNTRTGESFPLRCNTYACPECGPKKVSKLRYYLTAVLKKWDSVRFWTFTIHYDNSESELEQMKKLSKAWERFIIYIRRSKSLSIYKRKFAYVKVYENHKSGYWHLHVMVDCYLPYVVIQTIWESICMEVCNRSEHSGQSFVKGFLRASTAAYYVSKYVLKSAQEICRNVRRYSTSHGIKIFPEKKSNFEWIVLRSGSGTWYQVEKMLPPRPSLLVSHIRNSTDDEPPIAATLSFFDVAAEPIVLEFDYYADQWR